MPAAVSQTRHIYVVLVNGSGKRITLNNYAGDPDLGSVFGPSNQEATAIMDGRGSFLAWVPGDEQSISLSVDITDLDLFDGSSDDLENFMAFTGDYASDLGMAGNPGDYKTFQTEVTRVVNGRTTKRTIYYCKGNIALKGGAERNVATVSIEGYRGVRS